MCVGVHETTHDHDRDRDRDQDRDQAMTMLRHPDLGDVRYELHEVSDDPGEQVAQVIGLMRRYAVEDAQSPVVRGDLAKAMAAGPRLDTVSAIFYYVQSRIRFTKDEQTSSPLRTHTPIPIVEALIRPVDMAGMCNGGGCRRVGDCDDYAMYGAALLLAAGIPCAYVTVAADPGDPSRFSHVYVAAYPGGDRIALDTSHGAYPGWETSAVYERREWPLAGGLLHGALPILVVAALTWLAYKYRWWSWRPSWA